MTSQWKIAAIGGLGGALLAVGVIFAAADFGVLPVPTRYGDIHDYLMSHPDIIVAMNDKFQADQEAADDATRQQAVDKLGQKAFFDPRFAFVSGPANAKHTLVEFFDYNCPYCRASIPAMKKFYAAHKADTRFAFIEFPIKGPDSTLAARAALAARNQPDKYLEFHFALMSEDGLANQATIMADAKKVGLDLPRLQQDMNASSASLAIAAAHTLADAAKIDGTPAFIIDGHIREGAVDDDVLKQMTKS